MSDRIHNIGAYLSLELDEYLALLSTAVIGAFILTFNDWGTASFDLRAGVISWAGMAIILFLILTITLVGSKVFAISLGYTIAYRAHTLGLTAGAIICVASMGYLPIILPGGFLYRQPERLLIGKWHGHHKGWEIALIAASFPLLLLAWVLLLSPLYLATGMELFARVLIACCLLAIFACAPLPMVETGHGRIVDWWKSLRGTTFGLDVVYTSTTWWTILSCITVVFLVLAFLLTSLGIGFGIMMYLLAVLLGFGAAWVFLRLIPAKK
jgi:hypothetical protein